MAQPPRYSVAPTGSFGRQSMAASQQQSSPALVARIAEKRAELESLLQLRDLSGALAAQMEALEAKLTTLADGTEAVAHVLENWQNVLRAIAMASSKSSCGLLIIAKIKWPDIDSSGRQVGRKTTWRRGRGRKNIRRVWHD